MADYSTVPVVLRGPLVGDVMRTEPPPPGALGLAIPDGNGGLIDIGLADLADLTEAGLLQGSYTVQPSDVTTPASDLTIPVPGAIAFGMVAVEVPGTSGMAALAPGSDYTSAAGSFKVLASLAPALQDGYVLHYSYVTGTLGAVVTAPITALVSGVETDFATLAAAIATSPDAIHLHADAEVSTVTTNRFGGLLFCHGHAITVVNGGQLKLGRFTIIYNGSIGATGNGNIAVVGAGNPGTPGAMPPASECLQLFDSTITAPLNFDAVSAYQGLALRGNSLATNVASGAGPIYLFDLSEVTQPLPASFTLYDKRPGASSAPAAKLDLQVSTVPAQQDYIQGFFTFPFSQVDGQLNATGTVLDPNSHELIVPRAARGILQYRLAIKNATVGTAFEFDVRVTHANGSSNSLLSGMFSPAATGGPLGAIDTKNAAARFTVAPNDRIKIICFAVQPAALRGDDVTCYLAFIED